MKLSLLGHRIQYSFSPVMHRLFGSELGITVDYCLTDVTLEQLPQAVERLRHSFDGFNITKPYKEHIFQYVETDALAARLGAANTVRTDGMAATNTDAGGFEYMLRSGGAYPSKHKCRTLILGAGGAAKSAAHVLNNHCDLYIYNRTREKAVELQKALNAENTIKIAGTEDLKAGFDYVYNCTSLGFNGENCLPEHLNIDTTAAFADMIYTPECTAMLKTAVDLNRTAVNGMAMLVEQGRLSWEFFTGRKIDACITPKIIAQMKKRLYT